MLVYQAGIANVFSVTSANLADFGRDAKRLLQADFRACENFARGLAAAGVIVHSVACNEAGDIAKSHWTDDLESQPFSENFHPVVNTTGIPPLDLLESAIIGLLACEPMKSLVSGTTGLADATLAARQALATL